VADFVVTCVRHELAAERLFRLAGRSPVPRAVVMRRFFTFADFLYQNGLTTRAVAPSPADVHEYSELCRSDLTVEGWAFVRAVNDRWVNLMGRDVGDVRERGRLSGWLWAYRRWVGGRAMNRAA
jgi:hypothetical protein